MANNTNSNIINTNSSVSNLFGTALNAGISITGVAFNAGIQIAAVAIDAATTTAGIVSKAAVDNAPAAGRVLAQTVKVVEKATIGCGKNAVIGTETVAGKAAEMINNTAGFVATATPVVTATAVNTVGSCWSAAKKFSVSFANEYKTK